MINAKFYNKKCIGCGSYLSSDIESPSYVEKISDNVKYCKRCFRLINYGEMIKNVNDSEIEKSLTNMIINNNLVVMVIDLFDIKGSIIEEYKNYNNLILLINKGNVFPKNFNKSISLEYISKIFKELGMRSYWNIIIYDSKENMGIKTIYNNLIKISNKKKVYIIGRTNVGKSSLINALLSLTKSNKKITVSPYKNTTLNYNKIIIDKNLTIIDTPGFKNKNILSYIDDKDEKKILESKLCSKSFQIKNINSNQSYIFGNFISIGVIENDANSSITFYGYNSISITRSKFENEVKNINNQSSQYFPKLNSNQIIRDEIILDKNKKYTIFLSGIGFVVAKRISKLIITKTIDINLYITENSIM